ncbi:MAG: DNA helicase, partial [Bacteroidales bacterium]|nr:DNA helicase [Bacteroidales bacterium]
MVSESKDTARYYQPTEGNSMQETAYEFFVALEESLSYLPNISKVYIAYNQLFQRLLNQATSMVSLNFSGSFAKTDFLLKEHHASLTMKREVNATRIRLRKQKTLSDNTLEQWCYYDFRNLTQFVSLLYKVSIPEHLSAYFPKHEPTQLPQYELIDDYVRFIVDHWDNDHVYGTADIKDGTWELKVRYANGNPYYDFDWSYLAKLFEKGSQLNLIRPRERDGVVYPELIIFEPDYLLDISTVARCFTEYADSPKVNLLKKLEPSQNTEATMLGNFAGQLLDEEIHQLPEGHDYKTSVQQFWQNNAFKLLTSNLTPDFHEEAKVQRVNIRKAINQGLSDNVGGFNPKNCIVEPSFFSEMLGLQGRIDLLQLDYKVLIEQKSGKGLWPFDGFHIPKQREEHYVQMLLYMLLIRYNFSDIYAKNNNELFAFLLYSKYTESLLPLGFSPELTFRAIKLRNELAAQELRYTHPNGMRVLETLTAELLNEKGVRGKLWDDYQSKQISNTLTPIHQASELERAYYFRFLTFI